ncbi:energy transducer TonB [Candidatus Marinarcus aquaticus]|uniref:TonB C-terminal domain-containing protein n=1 Tax=Candidatus Marinarcus aquaticus TaxID=2044504 RepID=A0A4Q0XN70_9BACT|nr:energy transducer TonB [Candidatus Marinarcus aquaticus]RXJ54640.1 hypothetical protein CRV04_11440 [Candidatus Marinarcus aquaticus]
MTDRNIFYVSGFISVSVYVLVFLLLMLYLKAHDVKKIDAFTKTTVLELDIVLDSNSNINQKTSTEHVKNTKVAEKIVKQSTSRSVKQTADVKSLFSNVTTEAKKVQKEDTLNVEKSLVSSRFKSKFEKEKKLDNVSVSNLLEKVKQKKNKLTFSESKNQNDPYYSKIYEIISSRWQPTFIVDDLSAKVLITIYSDGRFDFSFLRYSSDDKFDASLRQFLEEQKQTLYPPHDKGDKTIIEVIFKAKDE